MEKHKWIVLKHPDHSPAILRVDRITGIQQIGQGLCLVAYGKKYVFIHDPDGLPIQLHE